VSLNSSLIINSLLFMILTDFLDVVMMALTEVLFVHLMAVLTMIEFSSEKEYILNTWYSSE